jgi:hypothetical protein
MPIGPNGNEKGWIVKENFKVNALAANDVGRQAMESGYIIARMVNMGLILGVEALDWSNLPIADPAINGYPWIDPTGHVVISDGAGTPESNLIDPTYLDFGLLPTSKPAMNGLAWLEGTGHVAISDGATPAVGSLLNPAYLNFSRLPLADPHIAGRPWIDPTAHLTVSAG